MVVGADMFELAETLYDAGYEYMLMRTLSTCFGCRPALVGRALIGDAVSLTPESVWGQRITGRRTLTTRARPAHLVRLSLPMLLSVLGLGQSRG